ncbi:MAG: polysaccharide deacetylase family protein [Deltaproteobacteria bacterium]|jgi:peptidoglycan/xylan/chitin deacetylase (PgdA/CDA1 family)|nr:polysaccharide deacetylase family protein [Deltaproteobacteria bacterium]
MTKLLTLSLFINCLISIWLFSFPASLHAADEAKVFVYHRFGDMRYPSTNVSLSRFKEHLEILREENFTVLTLGDVVDRLLNGAVLPERCAVLTVDDAYRSFLTGAVPLLREFGFPATLFVSTDTVGGNDYLNWSELQTLHAMGIEIGNHSSSHSYLVNRKTGEGKTEWRDRVVEDVARAQKLLAQHLGQAPELFAYPYGEYSNDLIEIVKQFGFKAAFAQHSGVVARGEEAYTLPRFPMGGSSGEGAEFLKKLLMRHMPVKILDPSDTIIRDDNPPCLRVWIDTSSIDIRSIRCYVPGQEPASVKNISGQDNVFEIQAQQPLQERRSKYTLTASDEQGAQWFWFSKLWVLPDL